jgi:hypothetical protein
LARLFSVEELGIPALIPPSDPAGFVLPVGLVLLNESEDRFPQRLAEFLDRSHWRAERRLQLGDELALQPRRLGRCLDWKGGILDEVRQDGHRFLPRPAHLEAGDAGAAVAAVGRTRDPPVRVAGQYHERLTPPHALAAFRNRRAPRRFPVLELIDLHVTAQQVFSRMHVRAKVLICAREEHPQARPGHGSGHPALIMDGRRSRAVPA